MRSTLVLILFGACLLLPSGDSRADGCTASLNSTLMQEKEEEAVTSYTFKVDVSSPQRCADVDYILKVVEASPEAEHSTREIPHHTRVRDGASTSAKVNYKLSLEKSLVSWKFEFAECTPCGAAQPD